ncbi:Zinc finger protein CONSTANS-LIKE 6 [Bienertia sinuspersici]
MKHEQERDIISANNSDHHCYFNWSLDVESEMVNFDLNINYGDYCGGNDEHNKSHHHQIISGAKEEENSGKVVVPTIRDEVEGSNNNYNFDDSTEANNNNKRRRIELRLNYEEGDMWPIGVEHRGNVKGGDGWREARVSRYREKRRTRLFSKKIRYEVRKLNAEKRPRLKGRFVKRTSLSQLHN